MKKILVLHLGDDEEITTVSFLGQTIEIRRLGTGGDPDRAGACIAEYEGKVDAIALEGFAAQLKLGAESRVHSIGAALKSATARTPIVDGSGVRDGLERWAVMLADRAQPGIFAEKIVLMTPGMNHAGLIDELNKHSRTIRYADPFVFFNLPDFPVVGSRQTLGRAAGLTLDRLYDAPFRRLHPLAGTPHAHRPESPFHSADILAGDIAAIRRYAPALLEHKTIVVEYAATEDLEDLRERGVLIGDRSRPSP